MPTFDGASLLITLDTGITSVDVQVDLYSDWKEFFKTGNNSRFPLAFSTEGGSPTIPSEVSGRNFFLRNDIGWRIRPAEEDAEIDLVGNLFKTDATIAMIIPTLGAFTVLVNIQRSSLALVEETGISGLTGVESATLTAIDAQLALIEGTFDHREVMRIILAASAGKSSGLEPTVLKPKFRDTGDTKDRIDSTSDKDGNRLTVVLDAS